MSTTESGNCMASGTSLPIEQRGVGEMVKDRKRLTTGDVMKHCRVSRSTVLRWIKSEKLGAYVHPDGQYRVTFDALVDFLKTNTMPVDEELTRGRE